MGDNPDIPRSTGASSGATAPDGSPSGTSTTSSSSGSSSSGGAVNDGGPCAVTAAFGAPRALDELNTLGHEGAPFLSDDELTIYYESARIGSTETGGTPTSDFWMSTRASTTQVFTNPQRLTTLDTDKDEYGLRLTGDGLTAYFVRQTRGVADTRITTATRGALTDTFGTSSVVTDVLSAGNYDADGYPSADDTELFFTSTRPATGQQPNQADLYVAKRSTPGHYGTPVIVPVVNSAAYNESNPVLTRDGLTLYFASARTSMGSVQDVWVAQRPTLDANFGAPVRVDALAASGSSQYPSWVSRDGCRIYFQRTVNAGDIWMASKR